MPSLTSKARLAAAPLGLALMLAACGGGADEATNSVEVQMKDLEAVDGTINDAMTDLDGVQVEGTAMAENGNSADNSAIPPSASQDTETASPASDEDEEDESAEDDDVVSEQ